VSRTSPVCLASVSSTAACPDTLCRVMVPVVSPPKRTSPGPTFPHPRKTRSTCRRYVTDSSTAPFISIDRQLLALTGCERDWTKQLQLDYSYCLYDIPQLVITTLLWLNFITFVGLFSFRDSSRDSSCRAISTLEIPFLCARFSV
jgi:hypothetical protein